jgi:hypothetical protein
VFAHESNSRTDLQRNHRPYGLDFIIFGNAGFIITNDFNPLTFEWIGHACDWWLAVRRNDARNARVHQRGRQKFFLRSTLDLAPTVDRPVSN